MARIPGQSFIRIRNFEEYQHYKHRTPPWVKLYSRLWREKWFQMLPDGAKSHLIGLLIVASQHENLIELDANWIAKEISATEPIDLELLLKTRFIEKVPRKHPASNLLAISMQVASTSRVEKSRVVRASNKLASTHTETSDSSTENEVFQVWNRTPGVRPIRKLDSKRKTHLRARLAEVDWPWRESLDKFPLPCFRNGKWKPNFDWFLKPETADRILEGKYDFEVQEEKSGASRLATDEDKRNYTPHG